MSNTSSTHQIVQGLGGSFFHWISSEVLPFILGSTLGLCVLVGVALNVTLLVVYVKRQLYKDPTSDFIPQIAIVDLIASFFVLLPSVVASIMGRWPLPDSVCQIHGVVVTWFQLLSFAFLFLIFTERVVKAWNPSLHDVTFGRHAFVVVISVITWAVDLLIALLPVLGIGSIDFDEHQHQCSLVHQTSVTQMHVLFALSVYSSPLFCVVCFALLLEKRRRSILNEQAQDKNKLIQLSGEAEKGLGGIGEKGGGSLEGSKNVPPVATSAWGGGGGSKVSDAVKNGPSKAWSEKPAANGRTPLYKKNSTVTVGGPSKAGVSSAAGKVSSAKEEWRRRLSRPPSQNLVRRIFRDSEDERDHHQAMTALITWSVLWVCWIWYMIASLLDVYASGSQWGGWYTLGVLMADATYCIKPVVYLAHNRHYRKAGKDTMPQAVKVKATKVRQSVSTAVDSIDSVLFHSPGASKANKFQAAIVAQQAAIRWKRRAAVGIGKFGKKKSAAGVNESGTTVGQSASAAAASAGKQASVSDASSASKPTTTTALAAAAMQKLAENKLPDAASSKTLPGTPGSAKPPTSPRPLPTPGTSTRLSTPGSMSSERPATKTSVILSLSNGQGGLTPQPPSTARSGTASVAEGEEVQPVSPFSPQEFV